MKGIKLVQRFWRKKIRRETNLVLQEYSQLARKQQLGLQKQIERLNRHGTSAIPLGTTSQGQDVAIALQEVFAHALILGASGAGKSYYGLGLLSQILNQPGKSHSFGILDAKGELFERAVLYLQAYLFRLEPAAREAIKKKIIVIDFSDDNLITPYNLLARKEFLADELMIANRIDTISEQFSGLSDLSVRMRMILKYLFLLMVELDLPLSCFEQLCADPVLLGCLVERSKNPAVQDYFAGRFEGESRSTLLALRQRIDALLVSEGVRLSLSASSAPDFTALQDEGFIILINTAGRNITRGISELLQGLILSDIKQSVFRRSNPSNKFIWFCDEAQNLYKSSTNREHMVDLLTMGRSFGSFLVLLTQSLTSAVRDQDVLNSLMANVRWVVMLRSTLRDAELIAPAIPVTGNRTKPHHQPFEAAKYMTEGEELKARLKEITKLPDRQGYCWLKAHLNTAVRITTPLVPAPHEIAGCTAQQFAEFARSEPLGQGVAKRVIAADIAKLQTRLRDLQYPVESPGVSATRRGKKKASTLVKALEEEYAKKNN